MRREVQRKMTTLFDDVSPERFEENVRKAKERQENQESKDDRSKFTGSIDDCKVHMNKVTKYPILKEGIIEFILNGAKITTCNVTGYGMADAAKLDFTIRGMGYNNQVMTIDYVKTLNLIPDKRETFNKFVLPLSGKPCIDTEVIDFRDYVGLSGYAVYKHYTASNSGVFGFIDEIIEVNPRKEK